MGSRFHGRSERETLASARRPSEPQLSLCVPLPSPSSSSSLPILTPLPLLFSKKKQNKSSRHRSRSPLRNPNRIRPNSNRRPLPTHPSLLPKRLRSPRRPPAHHRPHGLGTPLGRRPQTDRVDECAEVLGEHGVAGGWETAGG